MPTMQNETEFEIAGTTYTYKRLSPEKVLKGLQYVSPVFKGDIESVMANANDLLRMFVSSTKITHEVSAEAPARKLPLGPLVDKHFTGKPGEMMAYLLKCVQVEYGDFLPGQPGHEAVLEVANPFISLMGVSGSSGE